MGRSMVKFGKHSLRCYVKRASMAFAIQRPKVCLWPKVAFSWPFDFRNEICCGSWGKAVGLVGVFLRHRRFHRESYHVKKTAIRAMTMTCQKRVIQVYLAARAISPQTAFHHSHSGLPAQLCQPPQCTESGLEGFPASWRVLVLFVYFA